ncbi:acyltransferase family protein [Niastella sp. OAS944]|uniref:acyltransferase family protein n=1 Tax=Niastella sp. OAS944 TaxID=2664089 RepID=UPI00349092AE|nr:peptidoglycan/LPS O-acetylase OafA/YrhL [Chitinophagaceae bacterium OAS944]
MYLQQKAKLLSAEITEVPAIFQPKYFRTLDGLRAISILFVLVAHFSRSEHQPAVTYIFGGGTLGVHIFFVLSGFLITALLLKEKITTGYISLRDFYIRRFFRIIPVAFLFLLVLFIMDLFLPLNLKGKDFLRVVTFTENLSLTNNWYTHHFWSLSVEEQFYLIFPFFIRKNLGLYVKMSVVLIICSPVISYIAYHNSFDSASLKYTFTIADKFLNEGLLSILIGSLTSILLFKLNASHRNNKGAVGYLQLSILLLIWLFNKHPFLSGISMLLCAVLIALFISISMIHEDTFLNKFLNLKYIRLIGVLSYSLYIWQQLFTDKQPWKDWFMYGDSIILNTCALFLVAYISYYFYEKKFIKLKNRFKSDRVEK